MSEFFIKFKAHYGFLNMMSIEGSEVYEADTAKKAQEKCIAEFKDAAGIHEDEIQFIIEEIRKI